MLSRLRGGNERHLVIPDDLMLHSSESGRPRLRRFADIAVLPALRSPGAGVPYLLLAITLVAVAASGLLWTWLAALAALRGPLLNALRNE